MKSLDADVKDEGLVFLNELGLDPGIDHMEALRIIHEVKGRGGSVEEFTSYCGGIPAPEANNNPFGYKFSWSPMGVLKASKNPARFLMKGEIRLIPPESLFADPVRIVIPEVGVLEGYPNRDSLSYAEVYGIPEARTLVRGTLRYPGWCLAMLKLGELGYLDQKDKDLRGLTFSGFLESLLPASAGNDLKKELAGFLKLEKNPEVVDALEWLGLLSDRALPLERGSALDILACVMVEKLRYLPDERDMIILEHSFLVSYPGPSLQRISSTLVDFGVPRGDTAMSRTVGLPVAIAARLLLEGKIRRAGVQIPNIPEIYVPLLEELRTFGIAFKEKHTEEGGLP
jgi:saccharopine dehydrogenase (NADP+, L-glutamate forming)/spermidine synthase